MTVENGQKGGEERVEFQYSTINDSDGNKIELETPISLTLKKKPVKVLYKVLYK